MKILSFEMLHSTDFHISQPMAKTHVWKPRGDVYNAIGKPKISHTFLWFKNCSGIITDKDGNTLEVKENQLTYMAKGTEYKINFLETGKAEYDTIVIHFQWADSYGNDIAPTLQPIVCLSRVDPVLAESLERLGEEYKKNIVCIPQVKSTLYQLIALVCQKQKTKSTAGRFRCISKGIDLMERDSNLSISEIASLCGVSECYFRRLFQEYSGMSPMHYRQNYRIERAKQLLRADENYTINEIAQELHYSDIYHFSKAFKKVCGVSPTQYMGGMRGK